MLWGKPKQKLARGSLAGLVRKVGLRREGAEPGRLRRGPGGDESQIMQGSGSESAQYPGQKGHQQVLHSILRVKSLTTVETEAVE